MWTAFPQQQSQYRRKLFDASHSLRSMMFGQDRYRRRYWILPQCGGIFVEGMESGEGRNYWSPNWDIVGGFKSLLLLLCLCPSLIKSALWLSIVNIQSPCPHSPEATFTGLGSGLPSFVSTWWLPSLVLVSPLIFDISPLTHPIPWTVWSSLKVCVEPCGGGARL